MPSVRPLLDTVTVLRYVDIVARQVLLIAGKVMGISIGLQRIRVAVDNKGT